MQEVGLTAQEIGNSPATSIAYRLVSSCAILRWTAAVLRKHRV